MTIRERRNELDMSLGELARKAGLQVVDVSAFERSLRYPKGEDATRLAGALQWTPEELMDSLPSADELAKNRNQHQEHLFAAIVAARAEANRLGLGKGHGGVGSIECPVCKSQLKFSVATLNGHMWGAGDVERCVRWMQ
jgi:transcriptional regulator with XRE-family HTH domain